jgi:hypothetical protein
MTKADKILDRMRANPRDWRIEDLEAAAKRLGLTVRKPGGKPCHLSEGRLFAGSEYSRPQTDQARVRATPDRLD